MSDRQDSLLDFPCQFPIKAMGHASPDFDATVVSIIRQHVSDIPEGAVVTRHSRQDRYQSVTVTIQAESKEQLDAIYQSLSNHNQVLMCL